MLFTVNNTITVTQVGAFDSGSDGFVRNPITVSIYSGAARTTACTAAGTVRRRRHDGDADGDEPAARPGAIGSRPSNSGAARAGQHTRSSRNGFSSSDPRRETPASPAGRRAPRTPEGRTSPSSATLATTRTPPRTTRPTRRRRTPVLRIGTARARSSFITDARPDKESISVRSSFLGAAAASVLLAIPLAGCSGDDTNVGLGAGGTGRRRRRAGPTPPSAGGTAARGGRTPTRGTRARSPTGGTRRRPETPRMMPPSPPTRRHPPTPATRPSLTRTTLPRPTPATPRPPTPATPAPPTPAPPCSPARRGSYASPWVAWHARGSLRSATARPPAATAGGSTSGSRGRASCASSPVPPPARPSGCTASTSRPAPSPRSIRRRARRRTRAPTTSRRCPGSRSRRSSSRSSRRSSRRCSSPTRTPPPALSRRRSTSAPAATPSPRSPSRGQASSSPPRPARPLRPSGDRLRARRRAVAAARRGGAAPQPAFDLGRAGTATWKTSPSRARRRRQVYVFSSNTSSSPPGISGWVVPDDGQVVDGGAPSRAFDTAAGARLIDVAAGASAGRTNFAYVAGGSGGAPTVIRAGGIPDALLPTVTAADLALVRSYSDPSLASLLVSGAEWLGDDVMLIAPGLAGEDGSPSAGVNVVWFDANGSVRAEQVGANAAPARRGRVSDVDRRVSGVDHRDDGGVGRDVDRASRWRRSAAVQRAGLSVDGDA